MEKVSPGANGAGFLSAFLLVIWYCIATAAFVLLYEALSQKLEKPELLSSTLGMVAWPFVVFVIALPLTLLLTSNVRHLLGLKKTIDEAPEKLREAFDTAESLSTNLQETGGRISNDINGALGEIEARMTAFEGRFQRMLPENPARAEPQQLSPRERLAAHLEMASDRFYDVLEEWNKDGRRKGTQLVVTRGGGNRADLVDTLRNGSAFVRGNDPQNDKIAAYLKTTFAKQMSARRGGVTPADIADLDRLRQEAEELGARFQN